jgi:hypothetical protein
MPRGGASAVNVLNGWKEIATHLNQGVRTVQRWETLGLPIHRVRMSTAGPVVAFAKEVDAWQRATPVRFFDEISALKVKVTTLESEISSLQRALRQCEEQNDVRLASFPCNAH